ncbi:MAG TPA: cyclic nucleotide-binding protein, partial [Myxococcales bacterium]|nr:cyclic nucleotide-binding protein [Myxococcales bacterium]
MDLRKLKEKATEAFAKGKFAKAAELYEVYCAGDGKDLQARLRMGDAFAKAGAKEKAIGAYKLAAESFAREGFLPRAIAASKLILELDPTHRGVQQMLADLYAKRSVSDSRKRPATATQMPAAAAAEPAPAPPSFNEIDLPSSDGAKASKVIELSDDGGVDLEPGEVALEVDNSQELPPELAKPAEPEKAVEPPPAAPAAPAPLAPPAPAPAVAAPPAPVPAVAAPLAPAPLAPAPPVPAPPASAPPASAPPA